MGQSQSRKPRPLRQPLLDKKEKDDDPFCTAGGVCCCLICSNLLWACALATLFVFSRVLLDLRDSNAATVWLLKQLGKADELREHPLDDPWWPTYPVTNIPTPTNTTPVLTWILRQLDKEDKISEHPFDDPWWLTHPATTRPSPTNTTPALTWILRQLDKQYELSQHPFNDPWWFTHPIGNTTDDNTAALLWILEQLGEGEHLETHPPSDPWWTNRTLGPLNLPFGPTHPISPAVEWLLLKMGQEEALRRYNVSDPWWTHRPQSNITLNATNVTVTPLASAYVHSRRRLYSEGEQPTRLFVNGKVRVSEYVEYFSVPKDGFVKLIVAPESLRYVLKVLGMTERPWWDDQYWLIRNNASEVNITNTLNLNRANVASLTVMELVSNEVVIDGTLNTFGTVDFWPARQDTYNNRRLFSGHSSVDDHSTQTCRRCASISSVDCETQCVPHMHILGGVLGFNNHTCRC